MNASAVVDQLLETDDEISVDSYVRDLPGIGDKVSVQINGKTLTGTYAPMREWYEEGSVKGVVQFDGKYYVVTWQDVYSEANEGYGVYVRKPKFYRRVDGDFLVLDI